MDRGHNAPAVARIRGSHDDPRPKRHPTIAVIPQTPSLDQPLRSEADLFQVFEESKKPAAEWRVGAEMEKFGVQTATGEPLHYDGAHGVLRVMDALVAKHGWKPQGEKPGGPIIYLERGQAQITLEPGSQFELSGSPLTTVHEICSEFATHMTELAEISREQGITWLGLGFHPFAKRSDLTFVPKARYAIMRQYLPTRGALALDMMLRTCTVQANYDYADEADALRKMRVGLRLSPLTTAIFANSPWYEGAPHGGVTYRGKVWLEVDPDRSGLLPVLLAKDASYERYVQWALDVPMFLVKRDTEVIPNTGQTFRAYWKEGFAGQRATQGDWQLHLNTLFPEVRLKKTIEIRGADAQGKATRCALPALWTGIYYDERALGEADALTADWKHEELVALRTQVWQKGVRAEFRGKPLAALAERVIEIAEGGLERRGHKREDGRDERTHLRRLRELITHGMSPADRLLEGMERVTDFRKEVMKRADLAPAP